MDPAARGRRVERGAADDDGERQGDDAPVGRASFRELDQLEGLQLEDALSRLAADKVEAYLRGE